MIYIFYVGTLKPGGLKKFCEFENEKIRNQKKKKENESPKITHKNVKKSTYERKKRMKPSQNQVESFRKLV